MVVVWEKIFTEEWRRRLALRMGSGGNGEEGKVGRVGGGGAGERFCARKSGEEGSILGEDRRVHR